MIQKKIVCPVRKDLSSPSAKHPYFRPTHVKIEYDDEKGSLSLQGVEGALPSGNCSGSCGQIVDHLFTFGHTVIVDGWDFAMVKKLISVWHEYHLNDMHPGTEKQEAYLREHEPKDKYVDYTMRCNILTEVGLFEDEGYKYGHSWRFVKVPAEVLLWLFTLPDCDIDCNWSSYRNDYTYTFVEGLREQCKKEAESLMTTGSQNI